MLPRPELIIFGNSPVAQVLAQLGKILDFNVIEGNSKNQIRPQSYVVVATMGDGDEEALSAVAGSNASYIGFVASREKSSKLFDYLRGNGIADQDLKKIKSPAGLELGAESLPEIAFSVMAEILQMNRKQQASSAKPEKAKIPVLEIRTAIDPICGMTVDLKNSKYSSTYNSKTYFFCCIRCKQTFEKAPDQYLDSRG
jgi:xanthine dehydrogenase accessory factor